MKFKVLFIFCFLSSIACKTKERTHPVQFYYWKSNVEIGEAEKAYFNDLQANKLYIRVFDLVVEQGEIKPTAIINDFDAHSLKAQFIPVVFITNEVFQTNTDFAKMATNLYSLIQQIAEQNHFPAFSEIQIDCDWTDSTKENYFTFLKELKSVSEKQITCTLRLHQIKFKNKTGVPPVDKGYLMCYATSSPIEEEEKNSILDVALLKDYLQNINQYPIEFDVALPIYSWAIVTNHLGKKKLINGVSQLDLENENYQKLSANWYEANEDVFLRGIYLNKGFKIKLETISPELLHESKQFLDKKINSEFDWVYYHLDSLFLTRYTRKDLQ